MISPVNGFLATVALAENRFPRELDTSAGVSGPHDFAVRVSAVRPAAPPHPSHPVPYVRDDRETPLMWDGTRWTRQRRKTNGANADGEVVWS